VFTALLFVRAYPVLSWLVSSPPFSHLPVVELSLSFIYAGDNGAMVGA
jgi:hypothetical protein